MFPICSWLMGRAISCLYLANFRYVLGQIKFAWSPIFWLSLKRNGDTESRAMTVSMWILFCSIILIIYGKSEPGSTFQKRSVGRLRPDLIISSLRAIISSLKMFVKPSLSRMYLIQRRAALSSRRSDTYVLEP